MQTYTAIALLSLLGITLSASATRSVEGLVELLEIVARYIFLALTPQHKGDRSPERGSGRREFVQPHLYTHQISAF
ncbi:hypothetical protein QUB68_09215 [Microcoleus sp. A006_D1]|uniref:hypothetical protein n=1 Tax=Microcoleus sp. A006_D1 TaxID=3055267 RepID=UPI002FD6BA90